jgi:hypothetical protein
LLLLLLLLLLAAAANAQTVLVLTPDTFRPALTKWQRHRERQGYKVTVRRPGADVKGFAYVLLLGDVEQVPCSYQPGEIIKRWERDPRIASDNHLADLDGDGLPDLAVGRLPADNREQAAALLDKVLAYENNADFSAWRRRVNVVAGVGRFGKLQDWAIERVAARLLTNNVPLHLELHVTYCNPSSAFCPPPAEVAATTLERFNEGALIVAYLGHGSRMRLDSLRFKGRRHRIFAKGHAHELSARHGAPITALIACSTGHMDGTPDCLAEVMLRQPKGPVAVIAASRVSMPYGDGVFAKEFMDAIFAAAPERPTLGNALMRAKRRLLLTAADDKDRRFIDMLATPYQHKPKLRAKERAEHLYLYNLLGDPTMRIPLPAKAKITAVPGRDKLAVTGHSPIAGTALIEMVTPRTPNRPRRAGDRAEDFRKAYERANRRHVAQTSTQIQKGTFKATFDLPVRGRYVVRVFVRGKTGTAAGAAKVVVE